VTGASAAGLEEAARARQAVRERVWAHASVHLENSSSSALDTLQLGRQAGGELAGISSPPGTPVRPGWRSTRGSRSSIGSCSGWAGRLGGGGGWRCLGEPLRLPDELAEPFDGPLVGAEVVALQSLLGAPVLFGLLLEDPRQRR
jgi:hypothetical protein